MSTQPDASAPPGENRAEPEAQAHAHPPLSPSPFSLSLALLIFLLTYLSLLSQFTSSFFFILNFNFLFPSLFLLISQLGAAERKAAPPRKDRGGLYPRHKKCPRDIARHNVRGVGAPAEGPQTGLNANAPLIL